MHFLFFLRMQRRRDGYEDLGREAKNCLLHTQDKEWWKVAPTRVDHAKMGALFVLEKPG